MALVAVLGLLSIALAMLWVLRDLPLDNAIAEGRDREILLEAADGRPLGRVGPLQISNASREEFPNHVVMAVLSVEDRRFYQHWGIDIAGMMRAAQRNYTAGTIVEGGSTITQQLVKLRLLSRERTFDRKLREVLAAIWLEMRLDKDEILTRYLNSVYMGAGAQGLPAAAKLYFNKRLSELTLSEAALLAGLIKAPSRFNPLHDLAAAHERAAVVLNAMVENGVIDRQAAEQARTHPAVLNHPVLETEVSTWFSDWVAQEARDVTGAFTGTMRVSTTLDPRLQELAERVLADALDENAGRNVSQGALVAMRPDGAVVAMVGGRNYQQSQFNRAVQAQRQPGSAFKLFVYMAALRSGMRLEDTIDASPIEIGGWQPDNFGDGRYGTVTLAEAFARSINTAAVRLTQKVGVDGVIAAARDLGITAPLPKVPSLALGSADVSLLNLTAAYAGVLAGRAPVQPWGVTSFASPARPRLMSIGPPPQPQHRLGGLREQLIALLSLPIDRGTARNADIPGFAGGKTGTTQDYRDAWFIGFNELIIVGVWVGNDDRSPMNEVTGGSLPAVIWRNFMTGAVRIAPLTPNSSRAIERPPAEGEGAPRVSETTPGTWGEQPQQQGQCDFRACSARYRSFNAADCTYQPYGGGSRTVCEMPQQSIRQASAASEPATDGELSFGRCNLEACAAFYSSFRASDCTYQPYDGGPRRACRR
jgi:1A family penicillin-binding protein